MDNTSSEEMIGPDQGPVIDSTTGSDAACVAVPATGLLPDERAQPATSWSSEPLAEDEDPAAIEVACPTDVVMDFAPTLTKEGGTPAAVADGDVPAEVADSAEDGATEPRAQLPAVIHGGPIARYVRPQPHDPLGSFFVNVRRSLPPHYEFDEKANKICTRSGNSWQIPLCGPLWVCSQFRTPDGLNWSREVQFLDLDGVVRNHVVAAFDLISNGRGVVARLVSLGLDVVGDPNLLALLIRKAETLERVETLDKPGWTDGPNPAFALPSGEVIVKQTKEAATRYHYQGPRWDDAVASGTLQGWQTGLSAYGAGNPAAIFVISLAFVGPLLPILGIGTVGFHIYCRSSSGKSTVAAMAQSVWRQPKLQGWDVTLPALEQICRVNHQTFLVLDELPADRKLNLGKAIYLVLNGSNRALSAGKNKNRAAEYWNVGLLSTGEESAEDVLARNGGAVRAGHLVRFIDVGLARDGETIFPDLHGFADSFALVKHIESKMALQSGTAGRAFIGLLTQERILTNEKIKKLHVTIIGMLRKGLGLADQALQGEIARVIERFAAVITAGTVATHFGILTWPQNDIYGTVFKFAKRWLADRGGNVGSETGTAVARARDYLTRFGDSKFQSIEDARAGWVVEDLAGWVTAEHFHVTPAAFKREFSAGMGVERAARCLFEAGYLTPGGEQGSLQNKMPSGVKDHGLYDDAKDRPRCYSIKMTILAA